MNWYFDKQGEAAGPLDRQGLRDAADAGLIREATLVWCAGMEKWRTVGELRPAWWGAPDEPAPRQPVIVGEEAAERKLTAPLAPVREAGPGAGGGFLKRLFGFGKKRA